jgi:hypothetical protein
MVDIPGFGGLPAPYGLGSSTGAGPVTSLNYSAGMTSGQSSGQSTGSSFGTSFIPNYSQTPILENIAQYAAGMAPQVYQWGMQQYAKNQGNIDQLIRAGQQYASPQQIAADMGQAEAGVTQAGQQALQGSIQDLQSYGIDPSAGRYAGLEQAARVQTAASAAGAANQQRMADIATGNAMLNQGINASLQNTQLGYGASNAMNALLGTGMSLKYPPLGQTSTSQQQSTQQATNLGRNISVSNQATPQAVGPRMAPTAVAIARGGPIARMQAGGEPDQDDDATTGGFVSQQLSPSAGAETDDVDARLNAGEFVIPKDVAQWKGQEFFYKLMAQARQARVTAQQDTGAPTNMAPGVQ